MITLFYVLYVLIRPDSKPVEFKYSAIFQGLRKKQCSYSGPVVPSGNIPVPQRIGNSNIPNENTAGSAYDPAVFNVVNRTLRK